MVSITTDFGGLVIPVLALTIPIITCQRMIKISNGDDPLDECLGSQNNLIWSVSPSIDGIPLYGTAEIRYYINKQLVYSVHGPVLKSDNKLNYWIICNHVINVHDYINVFKLRHNILPCPARLRRTYTQINTLCVGTKNICVISKIFIFMVSH